MTDLKHPSLLDVDHTISSFSQKGPVAVDVSDRPMENIMEGVHGKKSHDGLEPYFGILAHDLKGPLRKIRLFSEYIADDSENSLSEQSQDYFQRIQKSISTAETLINNLLALTNLSAKPPKWAMLKLSDILDNVKVELQPLILEKQAKIIIEPLPEIEGDVSQLTQLFHHLLENALKYSQADIPPHIKIDVKALSPSEIVLQIEDNGMGFDSQHTERLFEPFQRLHGGVHYNGSGLGLTLCRKIVQIHHGTLLAHGVQNEGSTFTLRLPIRQSGH